MSTDWRELFLLKMLQLARILHVESLVSLLGGSEHRFTDYFKGFEKVEAVREIFGEQTEEVLRNLRVEFTWSWGYMWVNNTTGNLVISSRYLNKGNRIDIFLDLIHELVHVKQFMEGKKLFDSSYTYVDRPTEVEAYRRTVDEARKMGLGDERICEYLKTEWMSTQDLKILARTLNVECK